MNLPFCRGFEPPTKFSKKVGGGSLTGPQLLEGVTGKEGDDFFQVVGMGAILTKNKV